MPIEFKNVTSAAGTPRNFVPFALGYVRGDETRARVLLRPGGERQTETALIEPEFLANPGPEAQRTDLSEFLIGPFAKAQKSLAADPVEVADKSPTTTVVIADIGIAFWHRDFSPEGVPFFEAVASMDFECDGKVTVHRSREKHPCFFAEVEEKYLSGGNTAVLEYLAHKFPGSIYASNDGTRPKLGPSDFAHGTAMASLIVEGGPQVRLIALELPAEAYLDRSGNSLRTILSKLPDQVRQLTADIVGDVHILLPYAYTDGPVPGEGPPVPGSDPLVLETELQTGRAMDMFLPVGNFLQERLHARPADPAEPLHWSVPAQDPSHNTLGLFWLGGDTKEVTVTLDVPGEGAASIAFSDEQIATLIRDGDTAIAMIDLRTWGPWRTVTLTIGPTRRVLETDPATPGIYTVRVSSRSEICDLHACVLRDDAADLGGLVPYSRQSRLLDAGYEERDELGRWLTEDPPGSRSAIRRHGTASHLVGDTLSRRKAVAAVVRDPLGQNGVSWADYAGRHVEGGIPQNWILEEVGSTTVPGRTVLSNGAGRTDRIAGTSVAAALALRKIL